MANRVTREELLNVTAQLAAARIAAGHNPSDITSSAGLYVKAAESILAAVNQRMDDKAWIELK